MKNIKTFYEQHLNFAGRTMIEYFISPGIKCKFDMIKNVLDKKRFHNALDLGCSGNSILHFLDHIHRKFFYDIAARPLLQYTALDEGESICGDLTRLPFRDNFFDFITALDVLEHIKQDKRAVSEISRTIQENGIVVITVPHLKKYYTAQDRLIGHYRRYGIPELTELFSSKGFEIVSIFGVYGQLMKFADLQVTKPQKIEESIENLRRKYINSSLFRRLWDIIVQIGAWFMRYDALHQPVDKIMNVALIFRKK
ncbi:MAG: methyltransferase domain-containing protein [Promethearchaeia archaeon]